jgi:hypothetical protein
LETPACQPGFSFTIIQNYYAVTLAIIVRPIFEKPSCE